MLISTIARRGVGSLVFLESLPLHGGLTDVNPMVKARMKADIKFAYSDPKQFCSTVIMALDDDAGFSYIACGATALTHTIFPSPTSESETPTTESSESSQSSESESSTADTSEPTEESAPSESSTTSPEPEAASDDSGGPPNNTGAIIGGVLGGIALICMSVIATVWLLRRNRNQKAKEEAPPAPDMSMPMYYTYESAPVKHEPVELDGQRNIRPSELPG